MTADQRERRVRRRLNRLGYRLWKVRDNSRWWAQYGPFCVVDARRNMIVATELSIEGVESWAES